jgi:CHAT domain-containing protein
MHSAAQALRYSLRAQDIRKSIVEYQQAATEWNRMGDLDGEAIALGGEAESLFQLSRFSAAVRTLDRAMGLDPKNSYLHGWLTHLKARAFLEQWESKEAARYARESLRVSKEIDEPALSADALADLAEAGYWTSAESTAQQAQQALDAARSSGLPETAAHSLRTQAWIASDVGQLPQALSLMTAAEENFRRAGNPRLALQSAEDIAGIDSREGDNFGALTQYSRLAQLSQGTGNAVDYALQIQNIGTEYALLNRLATARVYFHMAEEAFLSVGFRSGVSLARGGICDAEVRMMERSGTADQGILQSALNHCTSAAAIAGEINDPYRTAVANYQMGLVYQRMAMVDRRRKLVQRAQREDQRALRLFETASNDSHSVHDSHWEAQERISKGEIYEDLGERREARDEFEEALKLSLGEKNSADENAAVPEDPAGVLEARYHVARWYAQDGQYDKADAELAPALERLEAARQSVLSSTLQASYFAAERKCYELAIELRMRQFGREPSSGADALALEMSERSRARGLLDALSAGTASGAHATDERETRPMQAKLSVDRAFDHRLKLLVAGGTKRELEANSAELAEALGNLERTEEDAHAAAKQPVKPAPTASADEIERASLISGTTFFEYALGDERSFLWVIEAGKRKSYVLPKRQSLENMVKRWRILVISQAHGEADADTKLQHFSAQLSCVLLADAVKLEMTRIVIVPDGGLAMLPFAALPENGCYSMRGEPLIVEHEINLTPSLSVFLAHKPTAPSSSFAGEVAIIADPIFDAADPRVARLKNRTPIPESHPARYSETGVTIPRLLNAGYEASAIREAVGKTVGKDRVFLAQGFDASVDTVLSPAMRKYRIWHLATHGVYDETTPEFSGLVLSLIAPDGGARFGFLKATDIARLSVPAELVVLSACDSAAGENLSGEGVMGLSYSFLRAGAKQVVSTLWRIDETKSRDLMTAFYKELMRNGGDAAGAMRKSQLTMIRQRLSSAPYYWAGFELTSIGQ